MFGKVQSKEVPLDPARARLAAAISERDEAERKADAAKSAVERASGLLEESAARLSSAVAALTDRRKEAAGRVLEAAVAGGAGMPDTSLRAARADHLDAADAYEIAGDALKSCMASRAAAERDLGYAQQQVKDAAAPILAAEAERALARVESVQDELIASRAVLSFLQGSLPHGTPLRNRVFFALPPPPPGVFAPDLESHSALAPWRAAREALLRDANAELPAA